MTPWPSSLRSRQPKKLSPASSPQTPLSSSWGRISLSKPTFHLKARKRIWFSMDASFHMTQPLSMLAAYWGAMWRSNWLTVTSSEVVAGIMTTMTIKAQTKSLLNMKRHPRAKLTPNLYQLVDRSLSLRIRQTTWWPQQMRCLALVGMNPQAWAMSGLMSQLTLSSCSRIKMMPLSLTWKSRTRPLLWCVMSSSAYIESPNSTRDSQKFKKSFLYGHKNWRPYQCFRKVSTT